MAGWVMRMVDFLECETGARIPVGPVTEDQSDQGRMQATWSVLEVVNPGGALVMQVEYNHEMTMFARKALLGHELEAGELIDAIALLSRMVDEIRAVLPVGWDFCMEDGVLGVWRIGKGRRWGR